MMRADNTACAGCVMRCSVDWERRMIMTVSLSSHRDRRVVGRDPPDEDGDRPEAQLIPVFEHRSAADLFAAHVSAVLAAQIFDADIRARDDDARVAA